MATPSVELPNFSSGTVGLKLATRQCTYDTFTLSGKSTSNLFTLFFSGASAVATRNRVLEAVWDFVPPTLSQEFLAGLQTRGTRILAGFEHVPTPDAGAHDRMMSVAPQRDLESELDAILAVKSLTGARLQNLLRTQPATAGVQQTEIGPQGLHAMDSRGLLDAIDRIENRVMALACRMVGGTR